MEERISIVTPDHVELDFELAGIGSRLLAQIVDWLLISILVFILAVIGAVAGVTRGLLEGTTQWFETWSVAIIVLLVFLATSGYFLLFEALNRGQTPGKKHAGIRVIRD